jgi:HSP20 family protein
MPKKKNKKTSKKDEFEITSIEEVDSWDELSEGDELSEEGQLAVDVYQDKNSIIIKSTVAGVEPDDIDITFDNDMITIRGKRRRDVTVDEDNYFYQECYWGGFSRSIILPVDVDEEKIEATIKNGILKITLPKTKKKDVNITVKDKN